MIIFNFEVPPKYVEKTGRGPVIFIVVLESENLERMKAGDPADLQLLEHLKGPMLNAPLKHLDLVIAYEEEIGELIRIKQSGNVWDIVRWLERGRKNKPGDCAPAIKIPNPTGGTNQMTALFLVLYFMGAIGCAYGSIERNDSTANLLSKWLICMMWPIVIGMIAGIALGQMKGWDKN